jgi:hypothetical protein
MQSTLPNYRFIRFRFYTPICVEGVSLVGTSIAGRLTSNEHRYYPERGATIAERYVNCECSPKEILRFTERFGPVAPTQTSEPFAFTISSWKQTQREFQKFWRLLVNIGAPARYWPLEGNAVEIRKGWPHFRCGTLWTFMTFELLRQPEKVRLCLRPDCKHPYFVAQHGKERYCSTDCANWSQAQLKKHWHEQQREKRKAAMKRKHAQAR